MMGSNRLLLLQMSLFRLILVLIAGIVIGLIIYTFTLDKMKEIAVLKLLGTPGRAHLRHDRPASGAAGVLGTVVGRRARAGRGAVLPQRAEATYGDIGQTLAAMVVVSLLASLLAVRRAMKVDARSVLGS
ncbi:MAG: hypothetical protein U0736_25045 [Gemmataceae bacterium]